MWREGAALKLRSGGHRSRAIPGRRVRLRCRRTGRELPPIAARRAEPLFGRVPAGAEVVIIGDTPADIALRRVHRRPRGRGGDRLLLGARSGGLRPARRVRRSRRHRRGWWTRSSAEPLGSCWRSSSSRRLFPIPRRSAPAFGRAGAIARLPRPDDRPAGIDRAGELAARDEVLRIRTYHHPDGSTESVLGLEGATGRLSRGIQAAPGDRAGRAERARARRSGSSARWATRRCT